jgi:hypothetical protein
METLFMLMFLITGFVMGRMTVKPEAPTFQVIKSPVKAYKEHKLTKEQEKEIEKYTTIMENVENYDGTGANQQDVRF